MDRVLLQGDRRPVADRKDAMGELRQLLASREPLYREAALSLDTSRRTPEDAAATLEREIASTRG
jgi:XRE family aerobic/anaerobic benzoate catabolism transcriptional regulator